MRKLSTLAAAGLLALAASAGPATPAAADARCSPNHCYGLVTYFSGDISAVGQELWTDCLSLDNPVGGDFGTHEMWLPTNAPNSGVGAWIEAGYVRGLIAGSAGSSFRYFWGEWTGSAFYSHNVASAPILNWVNFSLYRQSNNTWKIYVGGTDRGTTVQQASIGKYVQTGGETTTSQVYSHGKSRYLQWYSIPSNAWVWGNSPNPRMLDLDVYQVTHNGVERMEQISVPHTCNPLPGGPPGTLAKKTPTEADVKALAVQFADAADEKNPTVEMVATRRGAAQAHVKAGKVDSDPAVYLVQVRGNFTGHMVPRPPDSPAPKGDAITLTIDKATGEVTDWSLGKASDLAKLGSVKKL